MKWDQIETKWTEMTRRVQSQWDACPTPASLRDGVPKRHQNVGPLRDASRDSSAPSAE